MKPHRIRLGFATLVAVASSSFAETPPPSGPPDSISWKFTMKQKPSTGVRMGPLRVRLEETKLDEIRLAASVGEIAHKGDAGESIYWLCYTNAAAPNAERIWIVADGEMGGPEHRVTKIAAELVPNERATANCPQLPNQLKPVALDDGLWLGASEGMVQRKLGAPSDRKGSWQSYGFQGKAPGKCAGGFDVLTWLRLRFELDRVDSIEVGQVSSC